MPNPTDIRFPNHEVFNNTLRAVKESTDAQILIERAIGRAFIDRLAGKKTDLVSAYAALGGQDPVAKQLFGQMNEKFAAINMTGAKTAILGAVNHAGVAAGKSNSVRADNPVFKVEHTALNTLAALGGEEFAKKFNIHE